MTPADRGERRLLAVAALCYAGFLAYVLFVLRFDMFRSDVQSYWRQSFEWRSPFNDWWVPGYSLVIAAVRGLTFGILPPLAVMVPISALAYLIAVRTVYRIGLEVGSTYALEFGAAFALFPLVGLTTAVYPLSDISAIALFLLAGLAMLRRQWLRFALFAGAALVTHKVMWFFVPPLVATAFVRDRAARPIVPLAFVPLIAWIVGGYFKFHHLLWFIRFNYEAHTVAKGGLPVLGGLVETFALGTPIKIGKGVLIAIVLSTALVSGVGCARRRQWVGVWISAVVAFLVAAVNAYEIWIAVRFAKLLVVPWCLLTGGAMAPPPPRWNKATAALGLALLMLTNLAYGYYLAHYFDVPAGR